MLSTQSKSETKQSVKLLSTSPVMREESKTPEIEKISEESRSNSTPTKKSRKTPEKKILSKSKSSPLSSRAQRIKQSLRSKMEVSAVLLSEDGTSSEILYNGTSKQANIILGGRPTIIGEYEELGVIIVRSLNQSINKKLNKTILPVPFCNFQYNGPYLLYKVDNNGNPSNLRLEEYKKFEKLNKALTESARKNFNPIEDIQIKPKSLFTSNSSFVYIYI